MIDIVVGCVPPRQLSPNARTHWAVASKAKKAARQEGAAAILSAPTDDVLEVRRLVDGGAPVTYTVTVYWPSRRHRRWDDDNLRSALKPLRDGIADALMIDDRVLVDRGVAQEWADDGVGVTVFHIG